MKIKNLLAVLTAACLFATSFSTVAIASTSVDYVAQNAERIGAVSGEDIISHPKIKADKKLYIFSGTVSHLKDEVNGGYIVQMKQNNKNFIVFIPAPKYYRNYFTPEQLKFYEEAFANFENTAQVGKRIVGIGEYSDNKQNIFNETAAQFEVIYLETEGSKFKGKFPVPQTDPEPKQQETPSPAISPSPALAPEPQQQTQEEAHIPSMPEMIEQTQDELAEEDKRLNAEWKAVMSMLNPQEKKALRTKQRAWIKARDEYCKLDPDGGQAAVLENVSCLKEWTKKRADELAAMR